MSDFDGFICVDCGLDTKEAQEYYMVYNDVWEDAGMSFAGHFGDGMLCVGCIESRLGRELTPSDFPDLPINRGFFPMSDRLKSRVS